MKALQLIPIKDSLQSKFEDKCMNEFGLNFGVLAIDYAEHKYLNEHVQWLWKQFSRNEV